MQKQQSFQFHFSNTPYAMDNFIVSSSNREAYNYVTGWPSWHNNVALIYGDHGSGKTHLTAIWEVMTSAHRLTSDVIYNHEKLPEFQPQQCFIVEDIENISDESALFHLYNALRESQCWLFLTATQPPNRLDIALPDLYSRLNSVMSIGVNTPDDELLQQLYVKLFSDKQLMIAPESVQFLLNHYGRSFSEVNNNVERLDREALSRKKGITIPLIRECLGKNT